MASQGGIDGKDMCTSVKNMNGVLLANIKSLMGRGRTPCTTCQEVALSENRDLGLVCGMSCDTVYYTDGDPTNLQLGDKLFTDSSCATISGRNYYSNKCGARSGNVYLLDTNGAITQITSC